MKRILIIGSGISGLACAIQCARDGCQVVLASPFPSEQSKSVLVPREWSAGRNDVEEGDGVTCHVEDTMRTGYYIASLRAVEGMCRCAPLIVRWLDSLGTTLGDSGKKRTVGSELPAGQQIMKALLQEARPLEADGRIYRLRRTRFHSAILKDGICHGALLYREDCHKLQAVTADAVVMATGGQEGLFGKNAGAALCDGSAAGRLFRQGVKLRNLEFIQYHGSTAQGSSAVSEVPIFMGGIAVDQLHCTNLKRLYAVGECASLYHGAGLLEGNALLSAIYSGMMAAASIRTVDPLYHSFCHSDFAKAQEERWNEPQKLQSGCSLSSVREDVARVLKDVMEGQRMEDELRCGIETIDFYRSAFSASGFGGGYESDRVESMVDLAKAVLTCARDRRESRGVHIREDFPEQREEFQCATEISYGEGEFRTEFVNIRNL